MYDYLIVGAGLFGAVSARELTDRGKKCLVIDRRPVIAGNIYTEEILNINVHKYGAHIFHTSDRKVWDYVNRFADFNNYVNSPIANFHGELFNLPFNMNTFYKLWGVKTPREAKEIIESQRVIYKNPQNLEEQALSLVGRDIYEKLIKEYTEKQWGRSCYELPAFIIKRLPLRFRFDNNYFNDRWQGIPIGGYTKMIEKMLKGSDVLLNTPFQKNKFSAKHIIYSGMIDEFFEFSLGELQYRTLRFETEIHDIDDFQGNAVMNFTSHDEPYTRIIEHKHFEFLGGDKTIISREYPSVWEKGDEPFYPINDDKNNLLYEKYMELAKKERNITFGGRLGLYKYLDMDKVILNALETIEFLL